MNTEKIFYTHYKKGGRYEYIGEALHTETGERLVAYKKIFGEDAGKIGGKIWVRPYEMFFGKVEFHGEQVARFRHIPPRAGGIVLDTKGNILLMRRYRPVSGEYFVIPGGGIDEGETSLQAVIREIQEECSLTAIPEGVWYECEDNGGRPCTYFLIRNYSGTLALGGEEKEWMNEDNQYEPVWIPLSEAVQKINLYPENVRIKLKELL